MYRRVGDGTRDVEGGESAESDTDIRFVRHVTIVRRIGRIGQGLWASLQWSTTVLRGAGDNSRSPQHGIINAAHEESTLSVPGTAAGRAWGLRCRELGCEWR